ncbi:MAG: molybdenum cofactor biosynthesis protein MoaD [Pseudonocardia sp.]|jgi:molybdopterin converting factor small subunit|nr:molybdenum cofactor biosynthesis protein MoaD [Pseudonocardia sp.]
MAPVNSDTTTAAAAATAVATLTVRYFAAARAAAGTTSETVEIPAGTSVEELAEILAARHGAELAKVLPRCSYLVDEVAVRDRALELTHGATVDVLPPFAGG